MKHQLSTLCLLCFLSLQVYSQVTPQVVGGANSSCVGSTVTYHLTGATAGTWIVGGYHSSLEIGPNSVRFTWLAAPNGASSYTATVEATYSGGTASTPVITISDNVTPGVTASPTSVTIEHFTPFEFSVTGTSGGGSAPAYQWFLNNQAVAGATGLKFNTQTFNVTLENHDQVFVRMTSSAACASPGYDNSDIIPVTVTYPVSPPSVSYVSVIFNAGVTLTASGAGENEEYRWYDAPSGGNYLWQGLSFPISNVTNHKTYYVAKVNTSTSTQSERVAQVVTVIVPDPAIPTVSTNTCAEKTLSFTGAEPSGITWYWQGTSATGQETGTIASADTYIVQEATAQMYYLRARSNTNIWSNSVGVEVTTDPVDITVSTYQAQNALVQATHSITFGSGFVVPDGSQFEAEITITGECNDRYNWSEQLAYGENGETISRGRAYADGMGNLLQNQSIDVASGKVWLSQPLYDNQNNPSAGTLPAPILENDFIFKRKFVTSASGQAYVADDFDNNTPGSPGELNNPKPVGNAPGTVGWYYSSSNTLEPATPTTSYPYGRNYTPPGPDPTTTVSAGPGDQYKMGSTHEAKGERQKIGVNELEHYFDYRAALVTTTGISLPTDNPGATVSIGYKYITTGPDEKQTVTYEDADGRTLASAVVTGTNTYNYWSYTYYNAVGQVVATVAPEGINTSVTPPNIVIGFVTYYKYDHLGRLIETTSVDEGTSKFKYSTDGKIRFSQNAEQSVTGKFSYTNYDFTGRLVESGEYTPGQTGSYAFEDQQATLQVSAILDKTLAIGQTMDDIDAGNYATQLGISAKGNDRRCSDYNFILYDVASATAPATQNNLIGQVSKTQNQNATTWYSYDEFGQLEWSKQAITGLGTAASYQTIAYTYDYFGNVTSVSYQMDGTAHQFYHFYEYDQDQRLTKVYTSKNGTDKQLEATYYYYLHGPLKRVELANNLQGIDYVYNIDGSLKAINHADPNMDPGADGLPGTHAGFMKDIFGEVLDYNVNDYTGAGYDEGTLSLSGYTEQFGGAVKAIRWHNHVDSDVPRTYAFTYDDRQQLKNADFGNMLGTTGSYTTTISPVGAYKEGVSEYSKNGNIKFLDRRGKTGNILADYSYDYDENNTTNKLHTVQNNDTEFLTYAYDKVGRMISQSEKVGSLTNTMNVSYDVYGQVIRVKKNTVDLVSYVYDDRRNRVQKIDYDGAGNISSKTFYVYDVSGNVLAIYVQDGGNPVAMAEIPVYGAGRIGVYRPGVAATFYEVSDHLGNVRGVIGNPAPLDITATIEDNGQANMSNPRVQEMAFFKNLATTEVTDVNMNHSAATTAMPSPVYSSYLKWVDGVNGQEADDKSVGPAVALKVEAGDQVTLDVWAKFKNKVSYTHADVSAAIAAILGNIYAGPVGDVPGTTAQVFQDGLASAFGLADGETDTRPFAYLNYIIYDHNFNYVDGDRRQVPSGAGFDPGNETFSSHAQVTMPTINITEPGYIYVFVSNESENAEVWFDDLHVNQVKSSVVAGADYYPFGLPMENRQATREKYRYGYQGQYSEVEGETNLLSFELRMYDARIGRWISPDPNGQHFSPYLAMGNAPHMIVDPTGGFDIGEVVLPAVTVTATRIPARALSTAILTSLSIAMPKDLRGPESTMGIYVSHTSTFYKTVMGPAVIVNSFLHSFTGGAMPLMEESTSDEYRLQHETADKLGYVVHLYLAARNGGMDVAPTPVPVLSNGTAPVLTPVVSTPVNTVLDVHGNVYSAAGKTKVTSKVKDDPRLAKLAEETFEGNQTLSNEANGLIEQLSNGNMNPGIGSKSIGNGIFEARSSGGARVYFKNTAEGVEILAYSNKANQQTVINRLFKIY